MFRVPVIERLVVHLAVGKGELSPEVHSLEPSASTSTLA